MKAIDAAYHVLQEAGEALHISEITRRALDRGIWATKGKTPARTVEARIGEEIKHRGSDSRFKRVAQGTFDLCDRAPSSSSL